MTRTSRSMLIEASRTVNFEPSTSCHSTPTQAVLTLSWLDRKKSQTSNANLFMCMILKRSFAVSLLKSLKPHWVSFVFMPSRMEMMVLKTNETIFLWSFLCTFPSSSSVLLEPTTKVKEPSFFSDSISFIFASSLEKSLNFVAPSASTMRMYYPLATSTPALTAPPFPLFLGYQTTNVLIFNFLEVQSATLVVLSFEPSLTTMISEAYLWSFKYYAVSSSITGNLASSLQLGTTRDKQLFF